MNEKVFKSKELTAAKCLRNISPLINSKHRIIKNIYRVYEYYDDPKFYHFAAKLYPVIGNRDDEASNTVGGYSFISEDEALLKCIGEALERQSIRNFNKQGFIKSAYKGIKEKAVNPKDFVSFSKNQKQNQSFSDFNIDDNTEYSWIEGVDLIKNKKTLIPAQLVYLYYKLLKKEKWIYLPISTGTAGGSSQIASIVRAIYEIVERDAFLIYYLNKIPGIRVDLEKINDLNIINLYKKIQDYKLLVYCFDIATDIKIPTILTIVIDDTGIGPAVSLGLKSSLNINTAVLGSMQEALHPRGWIRQKVQNNPAILKRKSNFKPITLEDRALLWYPLERVKELEFMLRAKKKTKVYKYTNYSIDNQFKLLKSILIKHNMDLYFIDVSIKKAKDNGYYVSRVLIPQLYPFYLIEAFPYLGGNRLFNVPYKLGLIKKKNDEKSLNKFPHPFI